MKKRMLTPILLILLAASSACAVFDAALQATSVPPTAPQAASDTPLVVGSTATAPVKAASVTPYPTPTFAPSITPLESITAQPSLTTIPNTTSGVNKPANPGVPGTATTSADCYSAAAARDVTIPDGTIMLPGEPFDKTWEFTNNGSCPWPGSFTVKFLQGDTMQAVPSVIGSQTNPGKKVDVTVSLVAPKKVGTYKGYYRMTDKNGQMFGPSVYVSIVVALPTATPKPTRTPGP